MIKRSTWILLAIFLAVTAFALYEKYKPEEPAPTEVVATEAPTVEYLFNPEDGLPTGIHIETRNAGGVFKAVLGNGGDWEMILPVEAAADPGQMEAAASQISSLRVLTRLDLDFNDVNLIVPETVFFIQFSSGKAHNIGIGDVTPTGDAYYVRKDGGQVLVIERDGIDALLTLALFPPYLETPTAEPIATKTP